MNYKTSILGRKHEQDLIREYYQSPKAELVAVYGRRRVGKTYLVKQFFNNDFDFYFTGSFETPRSTQLTLFKKELERYSGRKHLKPMGFRVNTKRGIMFRQWANRTLKEYLLRGYAFHQQMIAMQRQIDVRLEEQNERLSAVESHLQDHDQKFDMIVKTPGLPNEGVFFDGQVFDAFKLVMQLVKSAEHRIILIDNYINEEILTMFPKDKPASNCYWQACN